MHPINFDSYVIVRLPNCRNHRHTNKKQLNQQVWQPKCNSRFNLEGPGLLEKKNVMSFSALFLMFTLTWLTRALKSPWKSVMSLKSPWIEKLLDILEKSLKFPPKSLNIFESSLNKKNFHLKKKIWCFVQRNDWKHNNTQIFLGDHGSVFIWFRCSRHSSFSVIWSTLGTIPQWGKVLQ